MATIELWIQLENHAWDICPGGKDRMTGLKIKDFPGGKVPVNVSLHSPVTGHNRTVKMFQPVRDTDGDLTDALIFRRYTPNWAAPDDRKVNPWDINELDPSDNGTMGTIPGPVIEAAVGDSVIVHFRNMDMRTRPMLKMTKAITDKSASMIGSGISMPMLSGGNMIADKLSVDKAIDIGTLGPIFNLEVPLPTLQRTHSMHTHGFVFAPTSDGAYPLTPVDPGQAVGSEAALWASVGVNGGFKQGDRVPPGGTFTYNWNTLGWPTTQGVWLYHDHSVCDMENVSLGAIGIVVIHPQPGDPGTDADVEQDVDIRLPNGTLDPAFLPAGSAIANPIDVECFPFLQSVKISLLPHQLAELGARGQLGSMSDSDMPSMQMEMPVDTKSKTKGKKPVAKVEQVFNVGEMAFQLNDKLSSIIGLCTRTYRTPPSKVLILQLYHEFANIGMCVNGRKYLGNTPTILSGPSTKMKFGVVGMGSMAHTFHLHGHRWVIPGPGAKGSSGLQFGSRMDTPVSQFEDTRVFGPANSFSFTINEGSSFMRASPAIGEWHMHCHVLAHMMDGMMGSLLIVNGGEVATALPSGQPCPTMDLSGGTPPPSGGGGGPKTVEVDAVTGGGPTGFSFTPSNRACAVGDTVLFKNNSSDIHSVVWDTGGAPAGSPIINTGGATWSVVMPNAGTFNYHCGVHGAQMNGTITVS